VDDAHFPPGEPFWKGGWIMVNAVRNTAIELLAAIKAGKFYSSQGPEFQSIKLDGQRLEIETTPVKFARLIGPRNLGKWVYKAEMFERAIFKIPADWAFARIDIEDSEGNHAWTNALWPHP
jgi:hypothetical protein